MASFGSTKCARNSVASRKACVEGVKNGTFFGKNCECLRASFWRAFRAKNAAFREKNKRALLNQFSRKQVAQATKSR